MSDLRKQEPLELEMNYKLLILGIIVFTIIFWIIGLAFRYYVYVGGSV